MSHDRGCSCGKEPYEYADCSRTDCPNRKQEDPPQVVLNLDWGFVKTAVECLAYSLTKLRPRLIVGISRGGLVPATMLSHRMNLPLRVVRAASYEGTRRVLNKPVTLAGWHEEFDDAKVLVVDEIVDTGATFNAVMNFTHKARLVALVNKKPFEFSAVASFCNVDPSIWVKFPWETDNDRT